MSETQTLRQHWFGSESQYNSLYMTPGTLTCGMRMRRSGNFTHLLRNLNRVWSNHKGAVVLLPHFTNYKE